MLTSKSVNMKSIYKYIVLSLSIASLTGCKKYVDIKTQGNLVPNQTINYRYLLNNNSAFEPTSSLGDFASSDIEINDPGQVTSLLAGSFYLPFVKAYTWQTNIFPLGSSDETDQNWRALYANILVCNTVINELPASDGTEADKAALIAEAKVHRADAYLALVNTYAKPFNATTAAADLGVPLLLEQTISQKLNRATIRVIYDRILSDLTTAVEALPTSQALNNLPSKASAYGELARCYLLMHDYTNAGRYADLALATRNTLVDLSVYSSSTINTYPTRFLNPEILLSRTPQDREASFPPRIFKLGTQYRSLLPPTDLRYTLFTTAGNLVSSDYDPNGRFFTKESAIGQPRNEGPSVPEMMLIRAEVYARNGDATNAMLWVNRLRQKRFRAADYIALTATNASDALVKVINERRIEFYGTSLRWYDMRRLKDEDPFRATYTKTFNNVTYTLTPGSDRYAFPIAEVLRQTNPELEQNP